MSWKFPFLDDDNYFYFANYTSSASGRVYHFYRWNLIDCVLNNQTFEELEVTAPGSIDSWIKINNILYASIKFSNNNKVRVGKVALELDIEYVAKAYKPLKSELS